MFRILVLLPVVLLMTGCAANGPAFTPAENLDPSQSLVYIYRPGNIVGCGLAPRIYIDEVEKGKIKNDGYLVYPIGPGKRMIEARWWENILTVYLDVVAGEEYYVRWFADSEGVYSSSIIMSFGLIPKEYALNEIRHTKKSE